MSKLFLILENQLFPEKYFRQFKSFQFFMKEDPESMRRFKFHKNRLLFIIKTMRNFQKNMGEKGYKLTYKKLNPSNELPQIKLEDDLQEVINKKRVSEVALFEIEDKPIENKVLKTLKKLKVKINIHPTPMFLSSRKEFKDYLEEVNSPFMGNYYIRQRKRLNILLDSKGKPIGGKWSFDTENRKKIPSHISFPKNNWIYQGDQDHQKEKKLIDTLFPKHPGTMENYWLPPDHKDAIKVLDNFIKYKIDNFGPYQDSITNRDDFVFHSLLSPYMNLGLITPGDIIDKVLKAHTKNNFPLNSLEGFIRQIIGWREFIRGIYQNYSEQESTLNFWGHKRKLKKCWYDGSTGIRFGVRLCWIPPASYDPPLFYSDTIPQKSFLFKDMHTPRVGSTAMLLGAGASYNYRKIFPIVSYEQDVLDRPIVQLDLEDENFGEDVSCCIKELMNTPDNTT